MSDGDKVTIGLTSNNRKIMDALYERGWFKDGMDIAKLAVAVAINSGVKPDKAEGAETIWNVGSFDSRGELKDLVSVLFPDTRNTPYRAIEHFMNVGMRILGDLELDDPNLTPVELIKAAKSAAPQIEAEREGPTEEVK